MSITAHSGKWTPVLFASTCLVFGLSWDLSWHMTIGRDSFWSPPHLLMYLGSAVAGLFCGYRALRTTFSGSPEERGAAVRFWGFRAPLGAWWAIWGAVAMIAAAPFDDWWHAAYGLDVEIVSPPHLVLLAGMLAIQIGALLLICAERNRGRTKPARGALVETWAAGAILLMVAISVTERTHRIYMHGALFYLVAAGVFPLFLLSLARGSRLRWPITMVALAYTLARLVLVWLLPLFPAEPELGPVYQDVHSMVPPDFPLLLLPPAMVMDLVMRRWRGTDGRLAFILGASFLLVLLPLQWAFASVLMSPHAGNWFLAGENFKFNLPPWSYSAQSRFSPSDGSAVSLALGLPGAMAIAVGSSRLGLWWGGALTRIQR